MASAAAVVACSSSSTTTTVDNGDSGTTVKKDSGTTTPPPPTADDAGATGACPECADNLCQNQQASSACSTCLQASMKSGGACINKVATACKADPDCVADLRCNVICTDPADGGDGGLGDASSDKACFNMAGTSACTDCCDTNHQTGSDTYFGALADCICGQ